jgi:hypothetical protein
MTSFTLVHPEERREIPASQAIAKCTLFQKNPGLSNSRSRVRLSVPLSIFRQFVLALEGNPIEITSTNSSRLSQLSEEFGFEDLSSKLLSPHKNWKTQKRG